MNGVKPESYYQDGGDEPVYVGTEMRGDGRIMLPPEFQDLLTVLDKKMKHGCRDGCPIPAEAQAEIPHAVGVIKDMGDGDIAKGLEKMRGHSNVMDISIETKNTLKDKVLNRLVDLVVVGVVTLIVLGLAHYFKGGVTK